MSDVLAVMDEAHRLILGVHTKQSIEAEQFSEARDAFAELVDAAHRVAYCYIDATGDWHHGFAVDGEDIAALRAALANVTGEPT